MNDMNNKFRKISIFVVLDSQNCEFDIYIHCEVWTVRSFDKE